MRKRRKSLRPPMTAALPSGSRVTSSSNSIRLDFRGPAWRTSWGQRIIGGMRAERGRCASAVTGMALRIEKAFGVKMDIQLQMQAWYDARTMRRRSDEIQVRRYKPSAAQPR